MAYLLTREMLLLLTAHNRRMEDSRARRAEEGRVEGLEGSEEGGRE
jgi:hypothetical protein